MPMFQLMFFPYNNFCKTFILHSHLMAFVSRTSRQGRYFSKVRVKRVYPFTIHSNKLSLPFVRIGEQVTALWRQQLWHPTFPILKVLFLTMACLFMGLSKSQVSVILVLQARALIALRHQSSSISSFLLKFVHSDIWISSHYSVKDSKY